ncbi:MAG: hypothetical protein KTR30_23785 [Saprospiraceae bacterium]|nr:hypothetical protein [Saprospiraceae bacterium]
MEKVAGLPGSPEAMAENSVATNIIPVIKHFKVFIFWFLWLQEMGRLRSPIKAFLLNHCPFRLTITKVSGKSAGSECNVVKWEFGEGKLEKKGTSDLFYRVAGPSDGHKFTVLG